MLLRDLHIEAYRGLSDLRLEGLGRVNVLFGQNNSGKSSVLEAAALLARPFDNAQWTRVILSRDALMSSPSPTSLWEMFPNPQPLLFDGLPPLSGQIHIKGELTDGPRELRAAGYARESTVRTSGGALRIQVMAHLQVSTPSGDQGYELDYDLLLLGAFGPSVPALQRDRAVLLSPVSRLSMTGNVGFVSTAIEQGKKADLIAMLRLFDADIETLDLVHRAEEARILIQHKTRGMQSLLNFGAGMQTALSMAAAVSKARGGLLLVDEIETGIHHSMLVEVCSHLFAMAAASDVQVLCTTHSLETIDALTEAAIRSKSPDDLCGYRIERGEGNHAVRRYQGAKLSRLREGGVDLR